jgi:hypothetical protein
MSKLTRRGARNVTATLDRLASLIQENPQVLGIDARIARDFAHRCDLLSDAIELTASANFPRQAADNEEGMSVKTEGWDADQIADEESGPLEHEADETEYMATFTESEHRDLGDAVEGGGLENGIKAASGNRHRFNLFA